MSRTTVDRTEFAFISAPELAHYAYAQGKKRKPHAQWCERSESRARILCSHGQQVELTHDADVKEVLFGSLILSTIFVATSFDMLFRTMLARILFDKLIACICRQHISNIQLLGKPEEVQTVVLS